MTPYKKITKIAGGRIAKAALNAVDGFAGTGIILMYHRVVDDAKAGGSDPALYVTRSTLDMHLNELSSVFDIVPLSSILETKPGKRMCAITFDDGWLDNYEVAMPVLQRYKAPATVFIPVSLIGGADGFWFQELWNLSLSVRKSGLEGRFSGHFKKVSGQWKGQGAGQDDVLGLIASLKELPASELNRVIEEAYEGIGIERSRERYILDWNEVRKMGGNGITFGSHGMNHFILTSVSSEIKKAEITGSLNALREQNVALTPFLSYPNGNWDDECVKFAKEAGYSGAVTTRLGVNKGGCPPFLLNRIGLHDDISSTPSLLWFRLLQALMAAG